MRLAIAQLTRRHEVDPRSVIAPRAGGSVRGGNSQDSLPSIAETCKETNSQADYKMTRHRHSAAARQSVSHIGNRPTSTASSKPPCAITPSGRRDSWRCSPVSFGEPADCSHCRCASAPSCVKATPHCRPHEKLNLTELPVYPLTPP
jgi:hypothetical protein